MIGYLDRLNLRPFEKRLVVIIAIVLFIVINGVFVVPHFSDWKKVRARMARAQRTLQTYQKSAADAPGYQARIESIQSSENAAVPLEEQANQFGLAIQGQAGRSGVAISSTTRPTTRTNEFFIEQSEMISLAGREEPLVDFLYNLGSGASLIRVRGLTLRRDASQQQLTATITLVASYQKKAFARPAGAPATMTVAPRPAVAASSASPPSPAAKKATLNSK
jgi:Tfp pilus assembly protein PilO